MKKSVKISFFLMAILLGALIILTFTLTSKKAEEKAKFAAYEDARVQKLELVKSVLDEEEKTKEFSEKLKGYEDDQQNSEETMDALEKELSLNKKLLGYEDVEGEGLQITLNDGERRADEEEDSIGNWLRIIHNDDMLKMLNELKQNGSEAISINGERVLATSEIYCSWAFISINGKKLPAPFEVEVVGDLSKLDAYMEMPFNQLNIMKNRSIQVQVEKKDKIYLKSATSPLSSNYLKDWKQ